MYVSAFWLHTSRTWLSVGFSFGCAVCYAVNCQLPNVSCQLCKNYDETRYKGEKKIKQKSNKKVEKYTNTIKFWKMLSKIYSAVTAPIYAITTTNSQLYKPVCGYATIVLPLVRRSVHSTQYVTRLLFFVKSLYVLRKMAF